ncbi:aldo/keto reductase [Indiicoccus explosivorum]|uniref:aldo/keto reductase n=1 Tax=Indiicoccus explosivorum TaxID=1917864 RepID=UPI000B4313CD|nr:aldo/keto reductase [Indiicoccus explosivorum]
MEKVELGNSGLKVSEIALGCMSLPDDAAAAERIIEEALSEGINYFDTADLYGFGRNEQLVGRTLKKRRGDVFIATKVGNEWDPKTGKKRWNPTKPYILEQVKNSLRRLETDYIDLYQLHGGTIEDDIDETIDAFETLKKDGVIRAYGISSIRPNVIRQYLEKSGLASIMMQYSLLDRRPEEWLDEINEADVSVVTRGTLAKGLLTGQALERATEQQTYLSYSEGALRETLDSLLSVHSSLHALALHAVLSHPAVTSIAAGASSAAQLQETLTAYRTPVDKQQIAEAKRLTRQDTYEQHRP